ncbi:MAG: tripartite tricarboxylate transporter substrate binding protein [Betaproteobacteria bacterium]|nr:tripartite tricarboxylate transporter substrate binding protein [Betaproteobacteria bacterium]
MRASHAAVLLALAGYSGLAVAQAYPLKPIRVVVPFPPAGAADILARTIGQKLTEAWGQQVVVDNRPGAGGNIGADIVAKATPDGYTLLMAAATTHAVSVTLYSKLPYHFQNDLAPVSLTANISHILLTHPSLPVKSVRDLVGLAKSRPNQLNWGLQGNGTLSHLETELFRELSKIQIQMVPYKGSAPGLTDLIAGNIQVFFDSIPPALPHVQSGRLRGIAVAGSKRSPAVPELPTIGETLKGFVADNWFGVMAPAGTPKDVVGKLNGEIVRILSDREIQKLMLARGAALQASTPEQFSAVIKSDIEKWGRVVKSSGARVE